MNKAQDLTVITKTYDFILWLIPQTAKFPKNQRYLIGERLERTLLEVLSILIEAKYTRDKKGLLQKANIKLEICRYLMRLSKDLKLISIKKYEHACRQMRDIGVLVGGWIKGLRKL